MLSKETMEEKIKRLFFEEDHSVHYLSHLFKMSGSQINTILKDHKIRNPRYLERQHLEFTCHLCDLVFNTEEKQRVHLLFIHGCYKQDCKNFKTLEDYNKREQKIIQGFQSTEMILNNICKSDCSSSAKISRYPIEFIEFFRYDYLLKKLNPIIYKRYKISKHIISCFAECNKEDKIIVKKFRLLGKILAKNNGILSDKKWIKTIHGIFNHAPTNDWERLYDIKPQLLQVSEFADIQIISNRESQNSQDGD